MEVEGRNMEGEGYRSMEGIRPGGGVWKLDRDTVGVKKYEERREKGRRMEYGRVREEI